MTFKNALQSEALSTIFLDNISLLQASNIFDTLDDLQIAVDFWITNQAAAIEAYGNINTWDVSQLTTLEGLFKDKLTFNSDISAWDVSNVTNMTETFKGARDFNQNIDNWTTTSLTKLDGTFADAITFNQLLTNWNVSSVTDMRNTFNGATSFNQTLNTWNTSQVTRMAGMFKNATSFDQTLATFNVENCTDWTEFLNGVTLSNSNYDTTLLGWQSQTITSSTGPIDFGNSVHTLTGLSAKKSLIDSGVSFTDGGGPSYDDAKLIFEVSYIVL